MQKTYKRPIVKRYQPVGLDRFDPMYPGTPGSLVLLYASWGPFRGIKSLDGRVHGSCGKGSLQPASRDDRRTAALANVHEETCEDVGRTARIEK